VDLYTLCLGERGARLEERDVGVLRNQLLKERLMRGQLSPASRRALWSRLSMASGPNLTHPPSARGRRQLRRNADARPLVPSSMYFWNRARNASGNGADMIHPRKQDESHLNTRGNPPDSGSKRNALV